MTEEQKARHRLNNKLYMRRVRAEIKAQKELEEGKSRCQRCTMLVSSDYHQKFPCGTIATLVHAIWYERRWLV